MLLTLGPKIPHFQENSEGPRGRVGGPKRLKVYTGHIFEKQGMCTM